MHDVQNGFQVLLRIALPSHVVHRVWVDHLVTQGAHGHVGPVGRPRATEGRASPAAGALCLSGLCLGPGCWRPITGTPGSAHTCPHACTPRTEHSTRAHMHTSQHPCSHAHTYLHTHACTHVHGHIPHTLLPPTPGMHTPLLYTHHTVMKLPGEQGGVGWQVEAPQPLDSEDSILSSPEVPNSALPWVSDRPAWMGQG